MTTPTLRRNFIFPLFSLAALTATSACCLIPGYEPMGAGPATLTEASMPVVTGTATYRERMMAPEGSTLKVVLQDTSRADAAAVNMAEWSGSLDDGGVPKAFTLRPEAPLDPRMTYTVRATISGPGGDLLWTTDTAHIVPVAVASAIDMGELVMVMVTPNASPDLTLAGTGWIVSGMGAAAVVSGSEPAINFTEDGRINGSTGCNRFFGAYTQDGAQLTFSGIGMTKMACSAEGVMAQEAAFASILSGEATASLDEAGKLTIMGAKGIGFVAEPAGGAAEADPGVLVGGEWVVEDINRGGVIDNSRLTLSFGEDGRVTGSTNCNTFAGGYTADGGKLAFTPLAMTRKACIGEALANQEQKYVAALTGEMDWQITGDGALELTGDEGRRVALRR